MKNIFIRRSKIADVIANAIQKEHDKNEAKKEIALADLEKKLYDKHEIELAELDGEIKILNKQMEIVEERAKGVERMYYKNTARSKENRRITTDISVSVDLFMANVIKSAQKVYQARDAANNAVKKIEKKESQDQKSMGNKKIENKKDGSK